MDVNTLFEEVLKQRIQGVKNEQGVWITPAFPKLLYVLEDDNIHDGDKYWYLTKLAAQCTAKRMVPDYISEKKMLEYKIDKNGNGNCYPCMGCRSFLTPYVDANGEPKYYGRFNQGVVTINLPDIALSSKSDYCQVCGYDGEIKIVDENNELIWECPNCGNRDKNKMNVARRTCGYIGSNFWNKGRTEEIAERYVHLDDHENEVN